MLWVSPVLAGRTRPVSSSFLPSLNQATQQTTAHPLKNDEGRPLARKAPQATPKKQRVKKGRNFLIQLKKLDIPESAKAARIKLVATLQDKKITCGQTFVDRVRGVCIWEKKRSQSADAPKRGNPGVELPPDVSRQFLRKSNIYFSNLATVGTSAKKQAINTSCLTGLLPKTKVGIKRFLDFQDDDLKELAESGSVRAFSALNQQFPENLENFKDFIDLFGEGENTIPRTHVTRFTSMHNGKGIEGLAPRAQAFWDWLQGKGWVDDFASISGLLATQGIPDKGSREDLVANGLEDFFELFGEEENKIPRTHLPRFTSMHHGKGTEGLASRAQAFWDWLQGKGWEDDFVSISGLLNQQGIPDTGNSEDPVTKRLENFFDLFGEEENKIPRTHLPRFTSMHGGKSVKGLALRAKAFWGWLQGKGWEDDFASISGLLHQQGIPDIRNSGDSVAKGLESFFDLFGEEGNKIPRRHLSRFTSIHCGKGVKRLVPQARAFWGWLQGKGWVDDFASISGLLGKQGIPDTGNSAGPVARELENFFDLFGEDGNKIPRKHLSRFTSMHHSKGVPPASQILALWTWLNKDSVLLWQAVRLFNHQGLPSLPTLNSSLDWLKQVTSWDGDDTMPLNTAPLKVIALHLGAPEKKRLSRTRVTSFIEHQKGGGKGTPVVVALARLLCRHGNDGVKAYQEMVDGDSSLSYPVIKLLLKAASVGLARVAVTEILPQAGFRGASHYLAVCRNIKPAPGLEEWTQIKRYIKTLIRALRHQDNCSGEDEHPGTVRALNGVWKIQRLYIDALWTLPPTGRQRFLKVRSVKTLLRVVRSITALNQLARANQGDSFQQQCRACLNTATSVLSSQDLENLFSLHLSLRIPWYQQHPAPTGGFCHASASASSTGVLIRSAPEHGDDGQKLWQPFAAAVVNGLNGKAVSRGKKGTFNLVCGEDEWVFDRPHLVFGDQGVTITNWTEEQYRLFGDAIELPGFEADDSSVPEPYVTTRQARLVPQSATDSTIDHQELSLQLIERLLKSSVQLRPQIWAQLEHQRTSLPDSILGLLHKMQNRPDMPEDLRRYVQAASREVTDTLNPGAMPDLALLKDFDITGNLVDDLLQPPVLTGETLKLLSPLVDDLTAVQLAQIIAKLDVNLPWDIREPWLERQAKSHPASQLNNGSWDLVEWLDADCGTIGTGRESDLDEFNNPSLILDWGDSETMGTFWGDLQEMDW